MHPSRLLTVLLAAFALPVLSAPANDSPQALLKELYRVHAQGEGPILDPTGQKVRRIYFTPDLAAALDRELNRPDPEEMGKLDFDPFYNAQDTELGEMDIAVPKVSGKQTTAIVRFTNFGENMEIVYRVVQEKQGWRIDDIEYGEGNSLRKTLRGD